jgi:hypothetical protein
VLAIYALLGVLFEDPAMGQILGGRFGVMWATMVSAFPTSAVTIIRLLVWVGLIVFVPMAWLGARSSVCQAAEQRLSPVVVGCVVDYDPTSSIAKGDTVESSPLVGHINGVERRAVLEFDISDLLPGQVDRARLAGRIGPDDSNDTGMRRHYYVIGVGDGVLDVSDNATNLGSVLKVSEHASGAVTDFDFDITDKFRAAVDRSASYLRAQVYAGSNPQGWDTLYDSSSPYATALNLQIRPVSPSTVVYYQPPVATGAAQAEGNNSFTIDNAAGLGNVMNWHYSPYKKGRALLEFDIGSIPDNAQVKWAKLDVYLNGLQNSGYGTIGPDLDIVGYIGDGTVSVDDLLQPENVVGTSGEINYLGPMSWDLDPSFVMRAISSGDYLGIRVQPGIEEQLRTAIRLRDGLLPHQTPRLVIAYEVPEPGTMYLLIIGMGTWLLVKKTVAVTLGKS